MGVEVETRRNWCGGLTERDKRNQKRFAFWTLGWGLAFVVATLLLRFGVVSGALSYLVAVAPTAVAAGTVLAYLRFLREADELQRKIQLESIAWGFGIGAVFMMSYRLLERVGLPPMDTSDPLVVMMLTWGIASLFLSRRYS